MLERLECKGSQRSVYAFKRCEIVVYESAYIEFFWHIELGEQIILAACRIKFRVNFFIGNSFGYSVGLAGGASDLHKDTGHGEDLFILARP